MKMHRIAGLMGLLLFVVCLPVWGAPPEEQRPICFKYLGWSYEKKGELLKGYIPALNENTIRAWELSRWNAQFQFSDHKYNVMVNNYDVFNIKKKYDTDDFGRENGFGLVLKSEDSLGDLFDTVYQHYRGEWSTRQWEYARQHFAQSANDPKFVEGHEFFYLVDRTEFLRTSGIVQRFGGKFECVANQDSQSQATFTISSPPNLFVKTEGSQLRVSYKASGYSPRTIRVIAVPKGGWLEDPNSYTLKTIYTDEKGTYSPEKALIINCEEIAKQLGVKSDADVDVIIDDGYGRTKIVPVTLREKKKIEKLDFMASDILLSDTNEVDFKFKYWGEDLPIDKLKTLVGKKGIPIKLEVRYSEGVKSHFVRDLHWDVFKKAPQGLKNGQVFHFSFGKLKIPVEFGKININLTATINDPKSPDYIEEVPITKKNNNSVTKQFVRQSQYSKLVVDSFVSSQNKVKTGEDVSLSAIIVNEGCYDQKNVLVSFYANEQKLNQDVRVDMPANRAIMVGGFKYHSDTPTCKKFKVAIDPNHEKKDLPRDRHTAVTSVNWYEKELTYEDMFKPDPIKRHGEWTVKYRVQDGYKTVSITSWVAYSTFKSEIGTSELRYEQRENWIYVPVTYGESLNTTVTVNTKQGIPTDKKKPKESDRESRGSWAIIPYAKKKKMDPNTITRAGYGVEIKVTTNYQTDWEKKVPTGYTVNPSPLGGTISGPTEVFVSIMDRKGNVLKGGRMKLERTGGDANHAIWELPHSIGGYRKYFFDKDIPDGEYTVKIETAKAGKTELRDYQTAKVHIYGVMYDDVQIVRSK